MVTTSLKLTDSQKLLGWNPISSTNSRKGDSFSPIVKDEIPSGLDNNIQILNPEHEILNKREEEFDSSHPNTNAQDV
jgi:hypothetical protein